MSGPVKSEAHASDFLGVWDLVSHLVQDEGGAWVESGPGARGLLIYTTEGIMSVAISWGDPTAEVRELFYAGAYRIQESSVIHEIWHSNEAWRIGQSLRRDFRWDGGELVLRGKTSFGQGEIRWKRRPQGPRKIEAGP